MRKKAKVQDVLEKMSVHDSLHAIRFAQVVVLLMDATSVFDKQDLQIAALVEREGRALVFGITKWDLVANKSEAAKSIREQAPKYISQTKTRPPTFVLKCSRVSSIPESYKRYLVNGLREDFDLPGIPIRLIIRADNNPYESEKGEKTRGGNNG